MVTVTVQAALTFPAVTVIVAEPLDTAVTRPLSFTVATASLSEDHVTESAVLSGVTFAISWTVFGVVLLYGVTLV